MDKVGLLLGFRKSQLQSCLGLTLIFYENILSLEFANMTLQEISRNNLEAKDGGTAPVKNGFQAYASIYEYNKSTLGSLYSVDFV